MAVGQFYTNYWNRAQQHLTEQGQITDRFTKAIDQIGQDGKSKTAIRLGGIYALERLMRDSDSPKDEPNIISVLCAFARLRSGTLRHPIAAAAPGYRPPEPSPPDVQAAILVLARRPNPEAEDNSALELGGTVISMANIDMTGNRHRPHPAIINLANADMTGSDFAAADLSYAQLYNSIMNGARLRDTDLSSADLSGVSLVAADARNADFSDSALNNADFDKADLGGAVLSGADLYRAVFVAADLTAANLNKASLGNADMKRANLTGANLRDSSLTQTDLNKAILADADLTGADLTSTDLTDADLSTSRGLTRAQLADAVTSSATKLPSGL